MLRILPASQLLLRFFHSYYEAQLLAPAVSRQVRIQFVFNIFKFGFDFIKAI